MYSSLALGFAAIWLAIINLGTNWSMKVFWWAILVFGVFKILENWKPLVVVVHNFRSQKTTAQ